MRGRIKIVIRLALSVITAIALFALYSKPGSTFIDNARTASGWITSCSYSHSLPDDPIVFFGLTGAASA